MKTATTINRAQVCVEALLVCLVAGAIGLGVNRDLVARSLDGSLAADVRQQLQHDIAARAAAAHDTGGSEAVLMIEADRAKAMFDQGGHLFIDARPVGEYSDGHIPGAINITPDTFDSFYPELAARASQEPLVFYCVGPECPEALELAEIAVQSGIAPVYLFADGWQEWCRQDWPMREGTEPW